MQSVITSQHEASRSVPDKFSYESYPMDSGIFLACFSAGDYLSIIFESFLGQLLPSQEFLLLTPSGHVIQSTSKARELCGSIHSVLVSDMVSLKALPQPVKQLHQLLMDSRAEFPGLPLQMTEQIMLDNGLQISFNGEWINLEGELSDCILIKIEDVTQTMAQRARCDACRYNFTPRETEVWALHMQGLSYREVGQQLFITMSTVRKHMKSIHSKRRSILVER